MKKRIVSLITVLAMLCAAFPFAAYAEGDAVSIVAKSGLDLTSSANLAAEVLVGETLCASEDGTEVKWFVDDVEVTDTSKLDGNDFIVTWEEHGKSITCSVDGTESAAIEVGESQLTNQSSIGGSSKDLLGEEKVAKSSAADQFTAAGKKLLLLDSFNNSKSTFLVLFNPSANRKFDTATDSEGVGVYYNYYNVNRETNIAYFMENDTEKITIPASVREHINNNWVWITEPAVAGEAYTQAEGKAYTTRAGIVLPAYWEVYKYRSIIGYQDTHSNSAEMLRTAACTDVKNVVTIATSAGKIYASSTKDPKWYRSEFTLDRSFFLDEDIELTNIGANVWKKLEEVYTYDELLAKFGEDTLMANGIYSPDFNNNMSVTGVKILDSEGNDITNGSALVIENYVGQTLKAEYTLGGSETPDSARVKWYVNGEEAPAYKTDGNDFIITWEESAATISCSVVPYDSEGKYGIAGSAQTAMANNTMIRKTPRSEAPAGSKTDTDSADIITVGDTDLVVLDTMKNNKSTFFVSMRTSIGKRAFDTDANAKTDKINGLNVNRTTNIAYYLNNDYFNTLQSSIKNHINTNHVWLTECANGGTAYINSTTNAYFTTCGINILADWEQVKYAGILGMNEGSYSDTDRMLLRTPHATGSGNNMITVRRNTGTKYPVGSQHYMEVNATTGYIRPEFYLDKDFFIDEAESITAIGDNVWAKLAKVYTLEEMLETGKYTRTELIEKGFESEYVITATYSSDSITAGSPFAATVSVKNTTTSNRKGIILAALYDDYGMMLTAANPVEVTAKASAVTSAGTITFASVPTGANEIRIFFWEDLDTIRPLCKHITK